MRYHKLLGVGLIIYGLVIGFIAFRHVGGSISASAAQVINIFK